MHKQPKRKAKYSKIKSDNFCLHYRIHFVTETQNVINIRHKYTFKSIHIVHSHMSSDTNHSHQLLFQDTYADFSLLNPLSTLLINCFYTYPILFSNKIDTFSISELELLCQSHCVEYGHLLRSIDHASKSSCKLYSEIALPVIRLFYAYFTFLYFQLYLLSNMRFIDLCEHYVMFL